MFWYSFADIFVLIFECLDSVLWTLYDPETGEHVRACARTNLPKCDPIGWYTDMNVWSKCLRTPTYCGITQMIDWALMFLFIGCLCSIVSICSIKHYAEDQCKKKL